MNILVLSQICEAHVSEDNDIYLHHNNMYIVSITMIHAEYYVVTTATS